MSQDEWAEISRLSPEFDLSSVPPFKRRFIRDHVPERGNFGAPLALEGTATALRTVIAGETDLATEKHLGRCYMTEYENSFSLVCDDPDLFRVYEAGKRDQLLVNMKGRIDAAAVMWNLVEGLFYLPLYFKFRLTTPELRIAGGNVRKPRNVVGGQGSNARFEYVKSLELTDAAPHVMRSYTAPRLSVETDGYWRRLALNERGVGRDGETVKGRTWVEAKNEWRERDDAQATIYIKSTIQSAKIQIADYIMAAETIDKNKDKAQIARVLYVLRCVLMTDEI